MEVDLALKRVGVSSLSKLYQGCVKGAVGTSSEVAGQLQTMEDSGEWIAEPKYDGIWASVFGRGSSLTPLVYSRNGKEKLCHGLSPLPDDDIILVGELAYGSQYMTSIRDKAGHGVIFVFDCLMFRGQSTMMLHRATRKGIAQTYITEHPDLQGYYVMAPTFYSGFVQAHEESHEGLILKPREADGYNPGTRNANWLKFKKKATWDAVIVGVEISTAETKTDEPMASAIHLALYKDVYACDKSVVNVVSPNVGVAPSFIHKDGKTFRLCHVGKVGAMTHELCREFAQHIDRYVGKVVEIAAFDQFKSGAFRHPSVVRIRDDKDAIDCVFDPGQVESVREREEET